jgi:hypothetical protein
MAISLVRIAVSKATTSIIKTYHHLCMAGFSGKCCYRRDHDH